MVPKTFTSWRYSVKYGNLHGKRGFADMVKVTDQMALRLGEWSSGTNVITGALKSRNPTLAGNIRENEEFRTGRG